MSARGHALGQAKLGLLGTLGRTTRALLTNIHTHHSHSCTPTYFRTPQRQRLHLPTCVERDGWVTVLHQRRRQPLHQRPPQAAALPGRRHGDIPHLQQGPTAAVVAVIWLPMGTIEGSSRSLATPLSCSSHPPPNPPPPQQQLTTADSAPSLVARAKPSSAPTRAKRDLRAARIHSVRCVLVRARARRAGSRRGKPTCSDTRGGVIARGTKTLERPAWAVATAAQQQRGRRWQARRPHRLPPAAPTQPSPPFQTGC